MDSTTSSLVLMDMPIEVLTQILRSLLVCDHNIVVNHYKPNPTFRNVKLSPQILRVNQRLYDIGFPLLRGANVFEFWLVPIARGIRTLNNVLKPHVKKIDISHPWDLDSQTYLRELDGLDWLQVRFANLTLICENFDELAQFKRKCAEKLMLELNVIEVPRAENVIVRALRECRQRNPGMRLLLAVNLLVKEPTTSMVTMDVSYLLRF